MGYRILLLSCCALWLVSLPAAAVVHSNGDGAGNAAPPPDDPGFANVGVTPEGLSGVYLGNRWVLTAAHVGERSFEFLGRLHPPVLGSRRTLQLGGFQADLAMVRLAGPAPPLPDLVLSSSTPAVGDLVTFVGNGWSRGAPRICWESSWTEVACPGGSLEGYRKSGGPSLRWGVNVTTLAGALVSTGSRRTYALGAVFDAAGPADEAQLVTGDSGGAAFLKRGEEWELVGIHFARSGFSGQPSNTAVFGNASYSADVFRYRDQIEAILLPVHAVPLAPWPALLAGAVCLVGVARRRLALT